MHLSWIGGCGLRMLALFSSDRTASVGLALGLSLMPMVAAAGVALDYSRVSNAQTEFRAILDAAALAGVRTQAVLKTAGNPTQRETLGAFVKADFESQIASKPHLQPMLKTTSIESTIASNVVTIKLCYTAEARPGS